MSEIIGANFPQDLVAYLEREKLEVVSDSGPRDFRVSDLRFLRVLHPGEVSIQDADNSRLQARSAHHDAIFGLADGWKMAKYQRSIRLKKGVIVFTGTVLRDCGGVLRIPHLSLADDDRWMMEFYQVGAVYVAQDRFPYIG